MNYQEAKELKAQLEAEVSRTGEALRAFPREGLMGLPTEAVRLSGEYREAHAKYEWAFKKLRSFNSFFLRTFKKEYAAERKIKRPPVTYGMRLRGKEWHVHFGNKVIFRGNEADAEMVLRAKLNIPQVA